MHRVRDEVVDVLNLEVAVLLVELVVPPRLAHQRGVEVHEQEYLQPHQDDDDQVEAEVEYVVGRVCLEVVAELIGVGDEALVGVLKKLQSFLDLDLLGLC